MYYERIFTDRGGLIVDGVNYCEDFRPATGYIDRILRGAKQATKIVQKLSSLLAAEGRYIGPAGLGDGDFQVSCPILLRLARHYGKHGNL